MNKMLTVLRDREQEMTGEEELITGRRVKVKRAPSKFQRPWFDSSRGQIVAEEDDENRCERHEPHTTKASIEIS